MNDDEWLDNLDPDQLIELKEIAQEVEHEDGVGVVISLLTTVLQAKAFLENVNAATRGDIEAQRQVMLFNMWLAHNIKAALKRRG